MAGYRLEQTTTGTSIYPLRQQQPEPGTVPPIKLRRITNNSWCVAGSITAVQDNLNRIETEPVRMPQGLRPTALVRPVPPQSSSGTPVSPEFDHVQMRPGDSVVQGLTLQNPVMVSYQETMEHFDPAHRDALHELLDSTEYVPEILEAATQLLITCKKRRIRVEDTLFSMLKFHDIRKHHRDLKTFFEKANVFFAFLNSDVARDTSCLTSILNTSTASNIRNISNHFISLRIDRIEFIARHPFLKEVAIVCHGKGLPEDLDMDVLFQNLGVLMALLRAWQKMKGIDNAVKDKPLDRALVTDIFSRCSDKSLPKRVRLNAFLQLGNAKNVKAGWQDYVRTRTRLHTVGKSKPEKAQGKSA